MYNTEYMENNMKNEDNMNHEIGRYGFEVMDVKERILYILESLAKETCSVKQLTRDIFGTEEPKKIRLIQQDIKMLKERYPNKVYSPKKGSYKLVNLPDFLDKLSNNDAGDLTELFEFIALFDAKMLKLFEQSEPSLVKKLRKEIRSIYHIKDDPIEQIHNKEIWTKLKKAVKDKRYISIAYEKDRLKAYNEIKPIKIVFARNNWYLAAMNFDEAHEFEFTFFRISHIVAVTFGSKTFHEDISALNHLKNLQTLFEHYKTEQYTVTLLAKERAAPYFKSKKYLKSQQLVKENEDGSLVISFRINNTMEILPIIKRWLPDLVVLEPSELKDKIHAIIEQYKLQDNTASL